MDSARDDWLIRSLTMYENIWMYELQDPTRCLSWMSHKELVVASCDDTRSKNEMMELVVGDTLFSSSKCKANKQVAGGKRDFTLQRGSFTEHAVQHMDVFPQQRIIATSGHSSGQVNLWNSEVDKGTFTAISSDKLHQPISSGVPRLSAAPSSSKLLMACRGDAAAVYDVSAEAVFWQQGKNPSSGDTASEELSVLSWLDGDNVFYSCQHHSGTVSVVDIRSREHCVASISRQPCLCSVGNSSDSTGLKSPAGDGPNTSSSHRHTNVVSTDQAVAGLESSTVSLCRCQCTAAFSSDAKQMVSVCSGGSLQLFDTRVVQTPVVTSSSSPRRPTSTSLSHTGDYLQLRYSPTNAGLISIAGLDCAVHILAVEKLQTGNGDNSVVFSHDGHTGNSISDGPVSVLAHSWHPTESNLLFSAADDGSVHAWRPKL